jgi:cytochrome c oxidase subunit 4
MSEHAEHEHPNYFAIFIALMVLLGLSIAFGFIGNPVLMNVLVFGVAGIKAILVARYFMHLKFEPRFVTVILIGAVLCLVALYIMTSPDIVWRNGWNM